MEWDCSSHRAGGRRFILSLACGLSFWLSALVAPAQSPLPDGFDPGADGNVSALALQADGRVLAGGTFTTVGGQARPRLARLTAPGLLDAGFNPGADDVVNALAVQADGRIVVGGTFLTLGGQPRNYLARLQANGALDTGFNPAVSGFLSTSVYALAVAADGKLLLGGSFTTVGGQPHSSLARLNDDGTVDDLFNPEVAGTVYSLAVQPDGKIFLGGGLTQVNSQTRKNLARIKPDGTLDAEFSPEANNAVLAVAVQADGKLLVGGRFTQLGGQPRSYLGRLHPDGSLDADFNPGASGRVYSLAVQTDGKILVGGWFTTLAGEPRNRLGRLLPDGTLDPDFDPSADANVYSLALQTDGKLLTGGTFGTLGGQPRSSLGRLNPTAPATTSLSWEGQVITWLRGGSSPEVWRTTFEHSPDGVNWTRLGTGTRIAGGWRLLTSPAPQLGILRARGQVASGQYNGSGWFAETTLTIQFVAPLTIRVDDGIFGVISNRFGFTISGPAGQGVVVQGSPDLQNWTALQTNTLDGGTSYFSDPTWSQWPARFYRVQHWP